MAVVPTGFLLVASPALKDPNFARSVVLSLHHDAEGSYGLVLNRSLDRTLSDVMPGAHDRVAGMQLFQGGPVQTDVVQVLSAPPCSGRPILDGVHLAESLELILEAEVPPSYMRAYAGYSGWGVDQLESETSEGSWMIAPARAEHVFGIPPDQLWKTVLRELGGQYGWLSLQDGDPDVN